MSAPKYSESEVAKYVADIAKHVVAGELDVEATLAQDPSAEWLHIVSEGLAEADRQLKAVEQETAKHRRQHRQRYERIYRLAADENRNPNIDLGAMIKACAEIAKLDGLYAPVTKTLEHSWAKSLSNEEKTEWERLSGLGSSRSSSDASDAEAENPRKH